MRFAFSRFSTTMQTNRPLPFVPPARASEIVPALLVSILCRKRDLIFSKRLRKYRRKSSRAPSFPACQSDRKPLQVSTPDPRQTFARVPALQPGQLDQLLDPAVQPPSKPDRR